MHNRNAGLQIGRAIACLSVVVGHATYMSSVLTDTPAPAWLMRQGGGGVNLFFVLSGYVMGLILRQGRMGAGTFLYHRALRIYPPYWAAALLFCGLCYYALGRPVPPFDVTALMLSRVILGASTYGVPAWTLVYEVVFYLLIFAAIASGTSKKQVALAATIWAVVIVTFDVISGQPYRSVEPGIFILVSPINLFFIAGLLLSTNDLRLGNVPTSILICVALLVRRRLARREHSSAPSDNLPGRGLRSGGGRICTAKAGQMERCCHQHRQRVVRYLPDPYDHHGYVVHVGARSRVTAVIAGLLRRDGVDQSFDRLGVRAD